MKIYPLIFAQQPNQPWTDTPLGTSKTATIGQEGCFCTTFATKAKYYGKDIDPGKLNKLFTDSNIYQGTDLLLDNSLEIIFGDIKYFGSFHYESIPADLAKLKEFLNDPATTVTLCISRGSNDFHFVEAVDTDGVNKVTIANSWSGNIEDFAQDYGDPKVNIWRFIVYKGPVPVVTSNIKVDPTTPPISLAARFTQAITKANNFDAIADYFGLSADDRVRADAGAALVAKIVDKDAAIEAMQKQREKDSNQPATPATTGVPPVTSTPTFAGNTPVNFSGTSTPAPEQPVSQQIPSNQPIVDDKKGIKNKIIRLLKILFL